MDFIIKFIGIILLVKGGSSPNVPVNTAFFPMQATHAFCQGSRQPLPHAAFVRVNNSDVANARNWPAAEQQPCDQTVHEPCTLFAIPEASELTVAPGFRMAASSPNDFAPYTCHVRHLGDGNPNLALIDDPSSASILTFKLPGGTLSTETLDNGAVVSVLKVKAPQGAPSSTITVTATPKNGHSPRQLVVAKGTTIRLLNLPTTIAAEDVSMRHDPPPERQNHFFLYNMLVKPQSEVCRVPPDPTCQTNLHPSAGGDPFCSNSGCCP